MNKYANPKDELRIKEAIAKAVCSGRSVFDVDENGNRPPEFEHFNMGEVGICASDMIVDGLLIERTGPGSVYVINASNGYKPTSVIPSKGLKSWLNDLKTERKSESFFVKKKHDVILLLLSVVINTAISWYILKR